MRFKERPHQRYYAIYDHYGYSRDPRSPSGSLRFIRWLLCRLFRHVERNGEGYIGGVWNWAFDHTWRCYRCGAVIGGDSTLVTDAEIEGK